MKDFVKVMKALSDPNRVKILKMLQHKVLCVCEMQAVLKIAQPTVSRHLKVLEDAGLVGYEKDGLWVNYEIARDSRNIYAGHMMKYLAGILDDDPQIVTGGKNAEFADRMELCKRR
ncbi:MAG: metalloregulator ArsR/SmtB family transcription factor [Syntrophales bacterium]|nr:metalloregulator ArsR/SmtB family transcription factor [Syntrophales bacterium]